MRISDWSSDVCSSDLLDQTVDDAKGHIGPGTLRVEPAAHAADRERDRDGVEDRRLFHQMVIVARFPLPLGRKYAFEIAPSAAGQRRYVYLRAQFGSASCRERVCASV